MAKRIEEHEISQEEINEYVSGLLYGTLGRIIKVFSVQELKEKVQKAMQKRGCRIEDLTDAQVVSAMRNFFQWSSRDVRWNDIMAVAVGDLVTVSGTVSLEKRDRLDI